MPTILIEDQPGKQMCTRPNGLTPHFSPSRGLFWTQGREVCCSVPPLRHDFSFPVTMSSATGVTKNRKQFTLKGKVNVLRRVDAGRKQIRPMQGPWSGHPSMLEDMRTAAMTKRTVPFSNVPGSDIVWGFRSDFMHSILLELCINSAIYSQVMLGPSTTLELLPRSRSG